MSRGHGDLQRWLLEEIATARHPPDVVELTRRYYGEGTDAQRSSVRRALRGLESEGLIHAERQSWHGRPKQWRSVDPMGKS